MPSSATIPRRGDALIFAIVLLGVSIVLFTAITQFSQSGLTATSQRVKKQDALRLAEAGIEKAVWCLNNPSHTATCPGNPNYTGESNVALGNGTYTVSVAPAGTNRLITATSSVSGTGGNSTHQIQVLLTTTNAVASFQYGLQAGVGGIVMENNNVITGNVYSNGTVLGDNNSLITGDAILAVGNATTNAEADPVSTGTTIRGDNATHYVVQSFIPTVSDKVYEIDVKLARTSSAPDDAVVMLYSDSGNNPGSLLTGASKTVPATTFPVSTVPGWENGWTEINFTPQTALTAGTRYWLVLRLSSNNASRYYTVLHGTDDAPYAGGTAKTGTSETTGLAALCGSACDLAFRVKMGGTFPRLEVSNGVGGNAFANTIDDTTVGGHACYQNLNDTVRAQGGSETCSSSSTGAPCSIVSPPTGSVYCHPGSEDFPPAPFPLTSAQIAQMEAQAAQGGVTICSPTCTVSTGTIGPRKYVGDLTISGTVTLLGTVWVEGNLTVDGTFRLSDAYGTASGMIIADKAADPVNSGRIIIGNGAVVTGNAQPDTFIMLLSASTSMNDATPAVDVNNTLTAGVVYGANGLVVLKNSANLKELTGQKIVMKNNASITYTSGLASVIFSGGPGASWIYQKGTYQILN